MRSLKERKKGVPLRHRGLRIQHYHIADAYVTSVVWAWSLALTQELPHAMGTAKKKKKRKKNYDALFKRMKKLQNPRLDILRSLSKTSFFGVFFTCVFSWKIGRSLEKYKTRSGWKMDYVYRFSNELSYAVFKMKEKQPLLLTSVCRLRTLPKQSYSPFKMTLADGRTAHPRLLMKRRKKCWANYLKSCSQQWLEFELDTRSPEFGSKGFTYAA